jgi:hypothetical protein
MVAPMPAVAVNRSRSPRTSGRLAPARMTPIVSSTTSFACRCTSFGTCSSVVSATKRASLSICCAICAFLLASAKLRSETGIRRACQIGALQSASAPRGCRPLSQFCGSGSRRLIPRGSPAVLSNNCEHRSRVQLNCRLPFAGSFFSSIGVFVFFELATTVKKRAALGHHYLGWIQAVDQNGSSSPLPQCALALSNARCVTATGTRHHPI